jgi:hypothetical protein
MCSWVLADFEDPELSPTMTSFRFALSAVSVLPNPRAPILLGDLFGTVYWALNFQIGGLLIQYLYIYHTQTAPLSLLFKTYTVLGMILVRYANLPSRLWKSHGLELELEL